MPLSSSRKRQLRIAVYTLMAVAFLTLPCAFWPTTPSTLAEAIRKADEVVIYVGLPHQLFEKHDLEEELRTKQVIEFYGYPFYQEPIVLTSSVINRLSEVFGDQKTYLPWSGPKLCGGFHPDYVVEWRVGWNCYRALICFGCDEVQLGRWIWSRYDLAKDGDKAL
ncbi:MAG: hypothetical protein QM703_04730 [Gemmatales bacterium]